MTDWIRRSQPPLGPEGAPEAEANLISIVVLPARPGFRVTSAIASPEWMCADTGSGAAMGGLAGSGTVVRGAA